MDLVSCKRSLNVWYLYHNPDLTITEERLNPLASAYQGFMSSGANSSVNFQQNFTLGSLSNQV